MFVLRLLLMLVVTGERYGTSPVNRRKLFRDESNREDDNAMWNDGYFDRLFDMENRAELAAPMNNEDEEAEEPEEEEEEEYETEEDAGAEQNEEEEVNDDDNDHDEDNYDDDEDTDPLPEYHDYG